MRGSGSAPSDDYQIDIEENPRIKWIQRPDTSPNGIDIKVDEQRWLADDFECKSYGPITDVHLWGSWKYDQVGEITRVHLSIHSDDPVGPGGTDPNNTYSKPDRLQWEHDFWAGQFEMIPVAYVPDGEYWWDPLEPGSLLPSGDWTIWRIDVYIDPCDAFIQDGDPCNPVIYWLDVQVDTYMGEFGWKTRRFPEQFMDDAVWDYGSELPRVWKELRYPKGHPYEGKSIDMAFVLTGEEWPRPKEPVPHLKWSQPPIEIDPTAITPTFCGWDEPSFATDPATLWKLVADDFRCLGNMPVTSIHWWGSYFRWEGPEPPEPQPIAWRVGFWSNVPANPDVDPNFSYPEKLLWQIELPVDRVAWEAVGDDFHPWFPYYDTCFQYYVKLEPEEYFRQGDYELNTRDNVFWISIAAIYPPEFIIQFPWGWKTRPWSWMDDAVWFEVNEDPYPGMPTVPSRITPIVDPYTRESSDVAFELDTDPNWIKWEQPFTGIRHWRHYEDVESMGYEDASGALNIVRAAADDWPCKRLTPVTAMVWWGSYIGYRYEACGPQMMAPPVKPDYFLLRIYDDVPAGVDTTYSHPNNVIWQYRAFDYDEVMVGYDKYPRDVIGPPREPVFRYSVRLPQSVWFRQKKVESIYWLSVTAVYKAGNDPTYHWGWTNHEYTAKDWAVYGFWDYSGPVPVWVWRPVWSDQAQAYVDLSFMLFTEPGCFPCAYSTYWDWLAYGKPGCWCALPEGSGYQCVGDADQATSGFPYNYRVFTGDLNWLITCWKMKMG
ncbi:MAG: DUF7901 domain-containing protein, partial [Planctomycetota bacterium]